MSNTREQLNTAITRARYGSRVNRDDAPMYYPEASPTDWHSDDCWPTLLRELVGQGWRFILGKAITQRYELICWTGVVSSALTTIQSDDLAACVCKAWLSWKERER